MRKGPRSGPVVAFLLALAAAFALAACGSAHHEGGSGGSTGSSTASTAGGGQGAAAAAAAIAPFLHQPSPFPVTAKLDKRPVGATFAYVSCGNDYCQLIANLLRPAVATLGARLDVVDAGYSANTVAAAFDSVVAKHPDAVIVSAIEPELYHAQLEQLQAAGVPVVTTGVVTAAKYGVRSAQYGVPQVRQLGKLEADYVAATFGAHAKTVFYGVPEIAFTKLNQDAFAAELAAVCPGCSVRFTSIPIATLGNKAPSSVVSDLQAHPDTTVAVFQTGEIVTGLPAALKAAGIDVKTLVGAPVPADYQGVKDGKETAVLASDIPVLAWTLADEAAREVTRQQLTGREADGLSVLQFLTKRDITFDPAKGWTGYPDFAQRFMKLWGG